MAERVHELWERLRPFAMRDIEQLANKKKQAEQLEKKNIILYIYNTIQPQSTDRVRLYEFNEEGLKAAIAGAVSDSLNISAIFIPVGVIRITTPITINKNIIIIGNGEKTVLHFSLENSATNLVINSSCFIKDVFISTGYVSGGRGILINGGAYSNIKMENVKMQYSTSGSWTGLLAELNITASTAKCEFSQCLFECYGGYTSGTAIAVKLYSVENSKVVFRNCKLFASAALESALEHYGYAEYINCEFLTTGNVSGEKIGIKIMQPSSPPPNHNATATIILSRASGSPSVSIGENTILKMYGLQYESLSNEGTLILLNGDMRSGGGSTTFLQLTDTPSSYSGQAGKIVKVKSDESGLEFGGATSGSGTENNVTFWGANNTLKDIDGIGYESNTDSLTLIGNTIYGDYGETLLSRGYFDLRRQSDNYNPFFVFWRSRQTSPGGVLADDLLGRISAYGHDGSNWSSGSRARINLRAAQNWSSTAHGTKLDVEVTPPNTTTPQKVLTIDAEGVKNEAVNKIRVKDYEVGVNAQGVEDADKLDGQHGSYYLNASNINAGTLSTDRFSAWDDLQAENRIGMVSDRIPTGVQIRSAILDASYSTIRNDFTTTSESGWSWATSPFVTPANYDIISQTWLRIYTLAGNSRSFYYQSANPSAWEYLTRIAIHASPLMRGGIRIDDGTDNNYIQLFVSRPSSGTIQVGLDYRIDGGTVSSGYGTIPYIYPYSNFILYHSGTTIGALVIYQELLMVYSTTLPSSFTPTRRGIFVEQSNYDGWSLFWFDYFGSTN